MFLEGLLQQQQHQQQQQGCENGGKMLDKLDDQPDEKNSSGKTLVDDSLCCASDGEEEEEEYEEENSIEIVHESKSQTSGSNFINNKNLTPRQKVIREIFETEYSYLKNLTTLVRLYVTPLRLEARGISPMVNLTEVHALFSDIEAVLRISGKFYEDMKSHLDAGLLDDNIGKVFCELAPLLKLYTAYVNSHHRALETHRTLLDRKPAYKQFCEDCKNLPESHSSGLDSFLILPVQRVPRYELLLKELLKHTDQSHPEREVIALALEKVSSVASMINDNLRDHERRTAVLAIQAKFGNSVQLVAPQRWFIREATLKKVCKRKPKPFLFVLFNDVLIYGSQTAMTGFNVNRTANRQQYYRYHRTINLTKAEVCACENSTSGEPQFQISSPHKSFKVITKDIAERDQWVKDIKENMEEAKRIQSSRRGSSNNGFGETFPIHGSSSSSFGSFGPQLTSLKSFTSNASFSSASTSSFSGGGLQYSMRNRRHSLGGSVAAPEYAPVKEYGDACSNNCRLCDIEFTYLRRRHFCGNCGIVVCSSCSPKRLRLPRTNKLKRICNKCFFSLAEKSDTVMSASFYQRRGSMHSFEDSSSASFIDRRQSLGSLPPKMSSLSSMGSLGVDDVSVGSDDLHSCSDANSLAGDWMEAWDPVSDRPYYWNAKTMEVSWEKPNESNNNNDFSQPIMEQQQQQVEEEQQHETEVPAPTKTVIAPPPLPPKPRRASMGHVPLTRSIPPQLPPRYSARPTTNENEQNVSNINAAGTITPPPTLKKKTPPATPPRPAILTKNKA